MSLFLDQVNAAIVLSGIFALLAVSMSLIYSVAEVVQFAQGDVMILGGYVGYLSASLIPSLPVAIVAAALVTGLLGLVMNEAVFRWLPVDSHLPLIAGIALSTVIAESLRLLFDSGAPVVYPDELGSSRFAAGGSLQFLVFGIAVAVGIALQLVLKYTRYGRALRATADNREMARLLGIPVANMTRSAFILGSAVAGSAGVLFGLVNGFLTPFLGSTQVFIAVAALLLGGLGSATGAIIGAIVVSFTEVFTAAYISSAYQQMFTFGLIILIMVVRPNGLFGRAQGVRA